MATIYTTPSSNRSGAHSAALIFFFLFLSSIGLSQDETKGAAGDEESSGMFIDRNTGNSVLIIPFEDQMYRSVADPGVAQENDLTTAEIRAAFRDSLMQALLVELASTDLEVYGCNEENSARVFKGIGYKSEKMKWPEPEKKGIGKPLKKPKKEREEKRSGTYIQDGQIRTERDTATRVMVPIIIDPALQPWLSDTYSHGRTLFLTQFAILPKYGLQYAGYGLDTATCIAQVHLSLFEDKRKVENHLVSTSYSPCYQGLSKLMKATIPGLALKIKEKLVGKEDEEWDK